MRTVAQVLAQNMKSWGVDYVFGVPGKPVAPLIFAVEDQGLQYALSRHEGGSGFAATGYAMQKGLGVAIGTSGPGGTNMLTAAGQAKAYHAPVLFITGHPFASKTGKAQGQDSSIFGTNLVEMFRQVTLFSACVERPDQFHLFLKHALKTALSGKKGPVHLNIPFDVFIAQIEEFIIPLPEEMPLLSSQLETAHTLLSNASRPVLFLGKGVHSSKAYAEVQALAERFEMPVMTTPGGKGAFPTWHPLSMDGFGLGGTQRSKEYLLSGVDVMVVIGTMLSDMSLAGFTPQMMPKHLIQFDYDITFMGESLPVPTTLVQGDAKANLRNLPTIAAKADKIAQTDVFAAYRDESTAKAEENLPMESSGRMSTKSVMKVIRKHLPENAVLYGDDGSHSFYAIQDFDIYKSGTFFFDDVFGAMGHAIGLAVGAQAAAPDLPIVCLTGDGCLAMHGFEIAAAVDKELPVIFIVINNGRLDMVEKAMLLQMGKTVGAVYPHEMKVAQFADSIGANAYRCHTFAQLGEALNVALAIRNKPTVIEVMVDHNETPPTLVRG